MERKTPFEQGEFYHIYNRGINKEKIFFRKEDWEHFLRLLYTRNSSENFNERDVSSLPYELIIRPDTLVDIVAYSLLPNHFHLLLYEKNKGGISKFMSKLSTAYSMYINTKYDRSGPLMCRPFRSKHIHTDEYLRSCFSYIHLNPIKDAPNKTNLSEYKYSSYIDYFLEKRNEELLLNKEVTPIDFSDLKTLTQMQSAATLLDHTHFK